MALSKNSTATATSTAKAKVVDHSKEIKALEDKVAELSKLLKDASDKIKALEELSKKPVSLVDHDLRKKLALWNPKLGQRL